MRPGKTWLFRMGLVLAVWAGIEAVAASLLAFSPSLGDRAAARTAEGDALSPPSRAGKQPYVVHPYLGFVLDPAIGSPEFTRRQGNPISSHGFLDASGPRHPDDPGAVRVGFFGGSVAYYFSVRGLAALERDLQAVPCYAGKRIVPVRAMLGGYKQPQQLMALNWLLATGVELDLVLNLDGFNEVALYPAENPGERRVDPSFPRQWPHLVQDLPADQLPLGQIAYCRAERERWARRFGRRPLRFSPLVKLTAALVDRHFRTRLHEAQLAMLAAPDGTLAFAATGPAPDLADDDAMFHDLAGLWERSSLQMDRTCRGLGIPYVHLLQPNQYAPDGKPSMTDAERARVWDGKHPFRPGAEAGYPRLREAGKRLAARGVAFHDLTELFSATAEETDEDSCCHLNGRGNELLGAAMARAIAAAPCREPRPAPGGPAGPTDATSRSAP